MAGRSECQVTEHLNDKPQVIIVKQGQICVKKKTFMEILLYFIVFLI